MGNHFFLPIVAAHIRELNYRKINYGENFPGSSYQIPDRKKWMENCPAAIPIHRIAWPGTHNSATKDIGNGNVFAMSVAECQSLSIYNQLQIGVRALDIRVQQNYLICHGIIISYQIEYLINEVKRFLGETEKEIIIIDIRTENGQSDPHDFENYLVERFGEFLIHQDDRVFGKTAEEVLPGRIILLWRPRNSPWPKAGSPLWNANYVKDDWISTDMPLTKFESNLNRLREQSPTGERNFFYRVENTVTAQTSNLWQPETKVVKLLSTRISGFARLFLAMCHTKGFLDRLQIYSTDYVHQDFVDACIGLTYARATEGK